MVLSESFLNNFQTSLDGAIDDVVTDIDVNDAAPFAGEFRAIIGSELILITATGDTTTWTVTRGAEGTTAAAHGNGSLVDVILTRGTMNVIHQGNGVRARHNIDQSFANNFYGPVSLNIEDHDDQDYHDLVTNNTRLTAVRDGNYIMGGHVQWQAGVLPGTFRYLDIGLNGGTFFPVVDMIPPIVGEVMDHGLTTVFRLIAGDFIELNAQQDSGAAINIQATGKWTPVLWMERIGK